MEMVTLKIDGHDVLVEKNATILQAAEKAGLKIPTLCYHPALRPDGNCRVCVVEVAGARSLMAACIAPVTDKMVVNTNTPLVREARRTNLELILANHPLECPTCKRNLNCELQQLALDMGVSEVHYQGRQRELPMDTSSPALVREPDKCIYCGRCVRVCSDVQAVNALDFFNRGFDTEVGPPPGYNLNDSVCVQCGQCATTCPVGAIYEKSVVDDVWQAIADPNKHVVVQAAPAVQVSIAEALGLEPGTPMTGKMAAALRRLGFDRVFTTEFTADLTILEEGTELLGRLKNNGALPLITSCSPGWIKFIEHNFPELLENLSTCKSPQQMFGALAKTYYAEKNGIDPSKIYSVSLMPCTAKKYEAARPEMNSSGYRDVDAVITTRELARMIHEASLDINKLADEQFDAPFGMLTGAATIFGTTGGVAEAALRTLYELVNGQEMPTMEYEPVRGLDGIKESSVNLGGTDVKIAVTSGLANAREVLNRVKNGEAEYHFIEIMACPGGCIGGGGQPIKNGSDNRVARAASIYKVDAANRVRKSHENSAVKQLYKEYLGEPNSHKAHDLLHTHYTPRNRY
ncbi:NADH-dependent [FeFe] hydrogenase, group A6 [Dethiobacter alkaliphilus]|uniref:NADH-dependent [FeFe] hydrogenase, group A6 n=1 Tax=Dethiobacter alkaliphilus TaxID=427926 RepID=UPI002227168C|nr:NADH-dependent [FeFe] hydrogenase, group A6 [Dethiobacter alkaliphilus]MCW3490137.1 NADH-dependent [FeFe] hydrogenase, group A6 [Dethiobacter alkaliphilus]